jgi:hypothetical protein
MANQFLKDPDTSNAVYKAIGISLHRKYFLLWFVKNSQRKNFQIRRRFNRFYVLC